MTSNTTFVFILMPFDSAFNDIYKLGIKECCKELGTYCERVDEQIFEENILDRIYNQINKADIIIADMTGKNANVFYETGYAHALNKRVILLTQKTDDIPFDLRHHHHIVYGGSIVKLKEDLSKRLDWFLTNPTQKNLPSASEFDFFIRGIKLDEHLSTVIRENYKLYLGYGPEYEPTDRKTTIKIDILNSSNKSLKSDIKIGIILEKNDGGNYYYDEAKRIIINKNQVLYLSDAIVSIFPNSWESFSFEFIPASKKNNISHVIELLPHKEKKEISFTVRVFSEIGTKDFPVVCEYE